MIFGRSIDGETVHATAGSKNDDAEGVVLVRVDMDAMDLKPLQFDPKEARDLARALNWAADDAERDLARMAQEELEDRIK